MLKNVDDALSSIFNVDHPEYSERGKIQALEVRNPNWGEGSQARKPWTETYESTKRM